MGRGGIGLLFSWVCQMPKDAAVRHCGRNALVYPRSHRSLKKAGMDGSRTHRGPLNGPPPVLKTGEPTGTQPPPTIPRIPHPIMSDKVFRTCPAVAAARSTVARSNRGLPVPGGDSCYNAPMAVEPCFRDVPADDGFLDREPRP